MVVPYEYTRTVRTIRVWYNIRIRHRTVPRVNNREESIELLYKPSKMSALIPPAYANLSSQGANHTVHSVNFQSASKIAIHSRVISWRVDKSPSLQGKGLVEDRISLLTRKQRLKQRRKRIVKLLNLPCKFLDKKRLAANIC